MVCAVEEDWVDEEDEEGDIQTKLRSGTKESVRNCIHLG